MTSSDVVKRKKPEICKREKLLSAQFVMFIYHLKKALIKPGVIVLDKGKHVRHETHQF